MAPLACNPFEYNALQYVTINPTKPIGPAIETDAPAKTMTSSPTVIRTT